MSKKYQQTYYKTLTKGAINEIITMDSVFERNMKNEYTFHRSGNHILKSYDHK